MGYGLIHCKWTETKASLSSFHMFQSALVWAERQEQQVHIGWTDTGLSGWQREDQGLCFIFISPLLYNGQESLYYVITIGLNKIAVVYRDYFQTGSSATSGPWLYMYVALKVFEHIKYARICKCLHTKIIWLEWMLMPKNFISLSVICYINTFIVKRLQIAIVLMWHMSHFFNL